MNNLLKQRGAGPNAAASV